MPNPPRYFSPEFIKLFEQAANEDPAFQKASRKHTFTTVLRCYDTPDGKDVEAHYHIDRGRMTIDSRTEHAPSSEIRNEPFDKSKIFSRTSAPYHIWTQLDRGEMSVLQALRSPEYVIEGPKLGIMRRIGVLNAMNAVAARLEKTY